MKLHDGLILALTMAAGATLAAKTIVRTDEKKSDPPADQRGFQSFYFDENGVDPNPVNNTLSPQITPVVEPESDPNQPPTRRDPCPACGMG
jgi:hypothetical protein